jgi:hypothetical protein
LDLPDVDSYLLTGDTTLSSAQSMGIVEGLNLNKNGHAIGIDMTGEEISVMSMGKDGSFDTWDTIVVNADGNFELTGALNASLAADVAKVTVSGTGAILIVGAMDESFSVSKGFLESLGTDAINMDGRTDFVTWGTGGIEVTEAGDNMDAIRDKLTAGSGGISFSLSDEANVTMTAAKADGVAMTGAGTTTVTITGVTDTSTTDFSSIADSITTLTLQGTAGVDTIDVSGFTKQGVVIFGGAESDEMTAGAGTDVILLRFGSESAFSDSYVGAYDTIIGFAVGTDKIDLLTVSSDAVGQPTSLERFADVDGATVTTGQQLIDSVLNSANFTALDANTAGIIVVNGGSYDGA